MIMSKIIWYLMQLLPLTYVTERMFDVASSTISSSM